MNDAANAGIENTATVDAAEVVADEYSLPPSITPPAKEPSCGCGESGHLERQEYNGTFHVSAKHLFDLMFGSNPDHTRLFQRYHKSRGEHDRQEGKRVEPPNEKWIIGGSQRVQLQEGRRLKVKEGPVNEVAFLMKEIEYFVYVVECRSQTPDVPYGEDFSPIQRFCITWINKNTCRLKAFVGVRFFKNPLMKGLIKSESLKGLAQGVSDLTAALKTEISIINTRSGKPQPAEKVDEKLSDLKASVPHAAEAEPLIRKEPEPVLPLEFFKSPYVQWGLLGLLALSLLLNVAGWIWSATRSTGARFKAQWDLKTPSGVGKGWEKELSGIGSVDRKLPILDILASQLGSAAPDVGIPSRSYRLRNLLSSLSTKDIDTTSSKYKLSDMRADISAAREEAKRTLALLDEAERA
ncbi:hypothetical protein BC829DRAFT_420817 [Chytridium lagenaria]|nr:hypothetical protein BC829DRAFT_420817 [Chytridium lagenaria]